MHQMPDASTSRHRADVANAVVTERRRLMIALLLEGEAATEVDGLRRALGAGDLARLAPHVTLVPPTNLRGDDIEEVLSCLEEIAATTRPLSATLGPIATFAPERPVVYLQVSGVTDELELLRRSAATGALAPPPTREVRMFVPHVTLAKGPTMAARAASVVEMLGSYVREVGLSRIHLLEQDNAARGRPWVPIASPLLGGRTVIGRGGRALEITVGDRLDPVVATWADAAWVAYSLTTYGATWRRDEPFAIVARDVTASTAGTGRIVGVARGEVRGTVCECERLIVDPSVRGEGVGSRLLLHVERLAAERNCAQVRLRTLASAPAERFYAARGFVRAGTLGAWRDGRDFAVMVRAVGSPAGGSIGSQNDDERARRAQDE